METESARVQIRTGSGKRPGVIKMVFAGPVATAPGSFIDALKHEKLSHIACSAGSLFAQRPAGKDSPTGEHFYLPAQITIKIY